MQLDHFFILTKKFAPEADLLSELGLVEGTPNHHPGQGTSNRRFFFSNSMLELLYVRDAREANDGPGRHLHFPDRAANPGASPFGLVLRCEDDTEEPVFPGWHYYPDYLDPGVSLIVGENSEYPSEPLCICMPDNLRSRSNELRSDAPFASVTGLRLQVPAIELSPVLEAVTRVEGIQIKTNRPHLLEIVFGHAAEGKQRDLRPSLPLRVFW